MCTNELHTTYIVIMNLLVSVTYDQIKVLRIVVTVIILRFTAEIQSGAFLELQLISINVSFMWKIFFNLQVANYQLSEKGRNFHC